jgi:hypothetical protein
MTLRRRVFAALAVAYATGCERAAEPVALGPPPRMLAPTGSVQPPSVALEEPAPVEPETPIDDPRDPADLNPILPDCVDDLSRVEPFCVWKRFALAAREADAVLTLEKDYTECPNGSFVRELDGLARNALPLLRKSSWASPMGAHCAAELPHCELVGSLTWQGSVFELRINFQGVGSVGQGDDWARFFTPEAGGGCDG